MSGLMAGVLLISGGLAMGQNPCKVGQFVDPMTGDEIVHVRIPPSPPPAVKMPVVELPAPDRSRAANTLICPAFDWVYGCSATAAGMMMGYYDRVGYDNMYAGATNGGIAPLDNSAWGSTAYASVTCGECPWIASHQGKDGRAGLGYVDDYWVDYGDPGPDPYVGNWAEHAPLDCTGDFMGTSQSKYSNGDGSTSFYWWDSGTPLVDYSDCEPGDKDGCRGLRQFVQSRGYDVVLNGNFTQLILPAPAGETNTQGFTYNDFKAEIDAGRPVLVHIFGPPGGHTMLMVGYNGSSTVYVHDTWDYSTHSMTWGGAYGGMYMTAVTVCQLPVTLTTGILTMAVDGNGDVTPVPGDHEIDLAVPEAITATADPGNTFLFWESTPAATIANAFATDTTVTISGNASITAVFAADADLEGMACGSTFTVDAGEVAGLGGGNFVAKPKFWAPYYDPIKDPSRIKPKNAATKVLTVVKTPQAAVNCEWGKKLCLYDKKVYKASCVGGDDTAAFLLANAIDPLYMALSVKTKNAAGETFTEQTDHILALRPPEITGVVDNRDGTMTITGNWFGTKKPKVWREYTDAKGAVKQQKFKILKPVDGAFLDSKNKCACMNATDGASQVIVVIPTKDPNGTLTGDLVVENGVGMDSAADDSQ
jgi:hypothetical protein